MCSEYSVVQSLSRILKPISVNFMRTPRKYRHPLPAIALENDLKTLPGILCALQTPGGKDRTSGPLET